MSTVCKEKTVIQDYTFIQRTLSKYPALSIKDNKREGRGGGKIIKDVSHLQVARERVTAHSSFIKCQACFLPICKYSLEEPSK